MNRKQDWHRYGQPFWSVSVVVIIIVIRIHSFIGNFNLSDRLTNKWYIVDLEVNTVSMILNMTGFEITEVSGHTAAVGHT